MSEISLSDRDFLTSISSDILCDVFLNELFLSYGSFLHDEAYADISVSCQLYLQRLLVDDVSKLVDCVSRI